MDNTFLMGTTSSITMQSLGKIVQRAPAVGAKMWCLFFLFVFFTGRMPRSGKLPVLDLLTHRPKLRVFAPQGRLVAPISSNLTGLTDTGVRLAVQNVTSIGTARWEYGPKNIKKFHFLVKSCPAGATPLTDFDFWSFYTHNYLILVLQISCDSHYRLRSYFWETARRLIRPNFSVHPVAKTALQRFFHSKFSKIFLEQLYTGWIVVVPLFFGFSLWRQMAP